MGEKRRKLYKFISACALEGVDNLTLSERILARFPDVSNIQIMKASLLAFTDRKLVDPTAFAAICDLAIQCRDLELRDPDAENPIVVEEEPAAEAAQPLAPAAENAEVQSTPFDIVPVVVKSAKVRRTKQKTPLNGISPS